MADANEFRHALRRERQARGLSQDAVGAAVHISGSQIGNYESGRSVPPDDVAGGLDAFFGTGDQLRKSATTARGEAVAPWLRSWNENEERAILLRTFQHSVIPGLLQTEAYARAVISVGPHTEDQVEEALKIRMARQAVTLDRVNPVELTAIICEPALRHGEDVIMKDQLEHLVDVGHRPNVHIRVIPSRAGLHPGHAGAFALATLPTGAPVGYIDDQYEGKVIESVKALRHTLIVWERLCGQALTCEQTRNLLLKVLNDYEQP
ncbi:helix-turn-helix transcriptional regulator [Solwaraspora sp. WMMD1047]|uniref:helix-turn-helix domain-containing protein n=1 Tax=Solwaraspora sp. WMMD1047 TaxID=3016102 RepID=UPI0024167595|nr:helix-turn-helix transcriptional regulator [Solwaraspora sp. WMMD1047]MDG4831808.1 helix-turn-helix transcriptional regulator [Solwaraspora sp. WMMD1047]